MTSITNALRAFLGLFFDDGSLALIVLALLLATGIMKHADLIGDLTAMLLLVVGTIVAVLENVVRTARAVNAKPL